MVCILLAACAGPEKKISLNKVKAQALPTWVQTPKQDTKLLFYGVGFGDKLSDAKQKALNEIAGKLAIGLSSKTSSSEQQSLIDNKENYSSSFKTQINSVISSIKLNNVNTLKTAKRKNGFYVLVAMKKTDFERATALELTQINNDLDISMSNFAKQSLLKKLVSSVQIEKNLGQARTLVSLLKSSNKNYPVNSHNRRYKRYSEQLSLRKKPNIAIVVKKDLKLVAERVAHLLTRADISSTYKLGQKNNGQIMIKGKWESKKIYGISFVKLFVYISVSDENSDDISSVEYSVVGRSGSSINHAKNEAINALEKKILKQGLLSLLGIK